MILKAQEVERLCSCDFLSLHRIVPSRLKPVLSLHRAASYNPSSRIPPVDLNRWSDGVRTVSLWTHQGL